MRPSAAQGERTSESDEPDRLTASRPITSEVKSTPGISLLSVVT
jgi:hypothetical protein